MIWSYGRGTTIGKCGASNQHTANPGRESSRSRNLALWLGIRLFHRFARAGQNKGNGVWQPSSSVDVSASASRCGVRVARLPAYPWVSQRCSSLSTTSTFNGTLPWTDLV
ncbi:hypothetical protein [Nonomuraea diastatica]|uniref:hypothetical protein n=1 Tax=Nonomuraea diastatica TaxID=1848329 RepID=UPI001FE4C2DD|nr:hypothetical protein [Nonomuraea diastatica]